MSEHFQLTMSMHLSPARPGLLCLWFIFKCFVSFFSCTESLLLCAGSLCFSEWGLLSSVVPRLLTAVASLAVERGLQVHSLQQLRHVGSVVVVHGLSCLQRVESSRTRDRTHIPCIGRQVLNHWTTRKPSGYFY